MVKSIVSSISGFKSIHAVYRPENQGLEKSITSGVSELVQQFGTTFRPRASFKDRADAEKSLATLHERIAANEAGYAAQERQTESVVAVETTQPKEEDKQIINGKASRTRI
jgi:hypothetical protein